MQSKYVAGLLRPATYLLDDAISALDKLYAGRNSIDDKIDFINPLINNSGRAKQLTKVGEPTCKYYSLETFTNKLNIQVTADSYGKVKKMD